MLKTVKNGSGIGVDPLPCFFKIPTFSRFFGGGRPLIFFLTNMGFPNGGEGGGPPLGKNSHIFPFFFLGASLSTH